MLQLFVEMLPFVVFVTIGVAAWYEPASACTANANVRRPRRFCEFNEAQGLTLSDPDGRPVPQRRYHNS